MKLLIFLISLSAFSREVLISGEKEHHYIVEASKNNFVMKLGMSQAFVFDLNSSTSTLRRMQLSRDCYQSRLIWVGEFLIGRNITCKLQNGVFRKIENRDENPFEFSITFFKETEEHFYFLINERDYLVSEFGKVVLKTINKRTNEIQYRDFILEVPGFSGAMKVSDEKLYIIVVEGYTENYLYEIEKKIFNVEVALGFSEIPKKKLFQFSGLSFDLFKIEESFLVDNVDAYGENYDSVFLKDSEQIDFFNECKIVSRFKGAILGNCAGNLTKNPIQLDFLR